MKPKPKQKHQIEDMHPADILYQLLRAGITQADIARGLNVTQPVVSQVIYGTVVSDRVRRAIAEAINTDIKRIWPSSYLYSEPRKPGRPAKGERAGDRDRKRSVRSI